MWSRCRTCSCSKNAASIRTARWSAASPPPASAPNSTRSCSAPESGCGRICSTKWWRSEMSYVISLVLIWAVFMGGYMMVSKYVKSSDVDKIKARLTGVGKKAKKVKAGDAATVVRQTESAKNRVAQILVEKFKLGPKIGAMLEQAGMNWQ